MIFLPTYRLVEFNVQNNEILDVGRGTCDQSVFAYGEMVRFEDNDRITSLYIYLNSLSNHAHSISLIK